VSPFLVIEMLMHLPLVVVLKCEVVIKKGFDTVKSNESVTACSDVLYPQVSVNNYCLARGRDEHVLYM
jgi:hypothetical protein